MAVSTNPNSDKIKEENIGFSYCKTQILKCFAGQFFKHKISFFLRNKVCYSNKDVLYIKNFFLSINRLGILTFFKKDIHFWTFKIDNHGKQWNYQLLRMLKESSG